MTIKRNKTVKISILILMLLLLFFSVKYYTVKIEFAEFKSNTELEIKILESQLGEILHKYDSLSEKSNQSEQLLTIGENVLSIKDQAKNQTASEKNALNDSLLFLDQKAKALNAQIAKKNQTLVKASEQKSTIATNTTLTAKNINVRGVKIYSDLYKSTNSKIQQLRVCYTLEKNEIVKAGSRKIYIQVVNPKNQIISKTNSFVENVYGVKLQFSALSEVNFTKNDTDVCAYVDLEQNKTIKGKYIINIYSDFSKIGSTIFEYK